MPVPTKFIVNIAQDVRLRCDPTCPGPRLEIKGKNRPGEAPFMVGYNFDADALVTLERACREAREWLSINA